MITYKGLAGKTVHIEAVLRTKPQSWEYRAWYGRERAAWLAGAGGDGAGWEGRARERLEV